MPELPEVQTIINDLIAANLVGQKVLEVEIRWQKIIAEPSAAKFTTEIQNREITKITRRGKFIVIELKPVKFLLVHLRMSGKFSLTVPDYPISKHEHLIFTLSDDRQLRYYDTRKFGRFWLVNQPEKVIGKLGVEPLSADFTVEILTENLRKHHRQIKPFLLDQTIIAGLGNIYVDEALWEACLHPLRMADSLNDQEIASLYQAIPKVLRQGLANQGTSLGNSQSNFQSVGKRGRNQEALKVFRRTGQACPRCGATIERFKVGQRSTHICPHCQLI